MSPRQYAKLPNHIESSVMADCAASLEKKGATRFCKRGADLIGALILLLLIWPVLLILAAAVALDSPGGALFRQERVGRFGRPFRILKFRTMKVSHGGGELTQSEDDRVTRVGRAIRGLRLDELPQLWNVLVGDMSLVGPRPEVPRFVDLYTADERATLLVRPGITCRSSIAFADESERYPAGVDPAEFYATHILPEKCAMNLSYVKTLSLVEDVKILFATLGRVFQKK